MDKGIIYDFDELKFISCDCLSFVYVMEWNHSYEDRSFWHGSDNSLRSGEIKKTQLHRERAKGNTSKHIEQ